MRGKALILIAAICCVASQAAPHGTEHEDLEVTSPQQSPSIEAVPSNGTPIDANPAIAYIPPTKEEVHPTNNDDMGMDMGMDDMDMGHDHHPHPPADDTPIPPEQMSYWLWPEHRGLLYAHISLMIVSWGFVLPVGVMLGVAQSPFHVPVQIAFITLTTIGVIFAIMYNSATPDFYENNAHHKIGWVIVWTLVAQVAAGMIRGVARYVNGPKSSRSREIAEEAEDMFMLGDDNDDDAEEEVEVKPGRRLSSDSGNETGESTPRGASTSSEPRIIRRSSENTLLDDHERYFHTLDTHRPRNAESKLEGFIVKKLQKHGLLARISQRGAFVAKIIHGVIGRPLFLLGFIQICTGITTLTGIFKGNGVYNGLAHFIKGGVFFNYGLITLGRYLGVFADLGWAWNLKPPGELTGQKWKNRAPSAEFVESFFIFFYGATQSFMEHLGNENGGIWSHKDLQHVSIAIMFFWAGLCGLLIETPFIRRCLNRTIEAALPRQSNQYQMLRNSTTQAQTNTAELPPSQQKFSFNPFPGLIIFMTGIMMSMHKQESMLSTMVHKQWGYLLAAFAIFRLGTYFLMFLIPPTSYIPSRPVTELLTSFCLICGGIIFMASNSDTVDSLDKKDVDPMFVFNLAVAASSLVMAWVIVVMAIKGWAVHRRTT